MVCLPPSLRGQVANTPPSEIRRHFEANLIAQGADPGGFDEVVTATRKEHREYIAASQEGFCFYHLDGLRNALVEWQGAQHAAHTLFEDPVGLMLLVPSGKWVCSGTPLATVRAPAELMPEVIRRLGPIIGTPRAQPSGPNFEAIDG